MTYKYKAKNGLDFQVPGVGQSKNGILETDVNLSEAPSLELVEQSKDAPVAPVESAQVAAPGAVIGVAPQATAPLQAVAPVAAVVPLILTNTEATL